MINSAGLPLAACDGTALATGAMVPADADSIIRIEDSIAVDGLIAGSPRDKHEWRPAGEEAAAARSSSLPARAILRLAATCGYDRIGVRRRPRAVLVGLTWRTVRRLSAVGLHAEAHATGVAHDVSVRLDDVDLPRLVAWPVYPHFVLDRITARDVDFGLGVHALLG